MSCAQSLWQQRIISKTSAKSFDKSCIMYYLFISPLDIEKYRTQFIAIHCKFFDQLQFISCYCVRLYPVHDTTSDCGVDILRVLWGVLDKCAMYLRRMIRSRAITRRRAMPLTYSISENCEVTCRLPREVNKWVHYGCKDARGVFLAEVERKARGGGGETWIINPFQNARVGTYSWQLITWQNSRVRNTYRLVHMGGGGEDDTTRG